MKQFYVARILFFLIVLFEKKKTMKLVACIRQRAIGSKLAKQSPVVSAKKTCSCSQKKIWLLQVAKGRKDLLRERFVTGKICISSFLSTGKKKRVIWFLIR